MPSRLDAGPAYACLRRQRSLGRLHWPTDTGTRAFSHSRRGCCRAYGRTGTCSHHSHIPFANTVYTHPLSLTCIRRIACSSSRSYYTCVALPLRPYKRHQRTRWFLCYPNRRAFHSPYHGHLLPYLPPRRLRVQLTPTPMGTRCAAPMHFVIVPPAAPSVRLRSFVSIHLSFCCSAHLLRLNA